MFEAWRARRAADRAARSQRRAAAQEQRRLGELAGRRREIEKELASAQQRLDAAMGAAGVTGDDAAAEAGLILKKGEAVFCVVTDAALIEPRKGPGEWKGRSQGVSVPIPGTKLRYRVGASKGHFQAGEEMPTVIDTGTFVVTSMRGVFTGQKQSREWQWAKLLSVAHYDPGWTAMAVAGRQKVSGVGVDSPNREALDFWIDLAVARTNDTTSEIEAACRSDVEQLTAALAAIDAASTPAVALPSTTPAVPRPTPLPPAPPTTPPT